jgi:succinyl-CoA synthetase beta subunit
LSGGRSGGRFSNGFIGGIHTITSGIEAKTISNNMLHQKLITKQAPDGVICDKVWIVEHLKNIKNEYYISIIMDRNSQGPLLIGSSFGGSDSRSSISDIALSNPNYIFTEQIDIEDGLQLDQCERMVENITGIDDQEDKVYIDTVNMTI